MIFRKKEQGSRLKKKKSESTIKKIIGLLKKDLGAIEMEGLSAISRRIVLIFNWFKLVVSGFLNNHCMIRASALTYVTILSLVPFLAVSFSILQAFGFQQTDFIREGLMNAIGNATIVNNIINSIGNASVGALGAIGVVALLFTVISLLGNIEKSFNAIWGIKKGRTLGRKFTDYLSTTLVAPLLMVVAMSATASLQSQALIKKLMTYSVFAYFYVAILNILPYFMVCIVFTFLYYFLTNTTVKLKSAFVGGLVAGIIWQIAQWAFIKFGVGMARSTALYKNFAPLFIFFLWVYISWVIVLLGSEISFAIQNFKTFQKEAGASKISNSGKHRLAVKILILLTRNFESDNEPMTNEEISNRLNIPVKLVNEVLYMLEKSKIVIEIEKEGGEYYTLIKPPERIRITDVVRYLNDFKEESVKMPSDREYKFIESLFEKLDMATETSQANITLKELIARIS